MRLNYIVFDALRAIVTRKDAKKLGKLRILRKYIGPISLPVSSLDFRNCCRYNAVCPADSDPTQVIQRLQNRRDSSLIRVFQPRNAGNFIVALPWGKRFLMWRRKEMSLVKNEKGNSDFGWIGTGIEVTGDIFFAKSLQIDGKVSGKLSSESGTLIIGESGQVEAEVDVGICVIHGNLRGNLAAKSRVEIHRSGKVYGDVVTPVLVVDEGASFNGAIKMGQEPVSRRLGENLPQEIDTRDQRKVKGA